jgi:hypothetical protein
MDGVYRLGDRDRRVEDYSDFGEYGGVEGDRRDYIGGKIRIGYKWRSPS